MRRFGLIAALIVTPFIALWWASVAFYSGWVGGWSLVFDEWNNE